MFLKKFGPTFWSTKIMTLQKMGPKSLVKVGPVAAEILLIRTNVFGLNLGGQILVLLSVSNRNLWKNFFGPKMD